MFIIKAFTIATHHRKIKLAKEEKKDRKGKRGKSKENRTES